MVEIRTFCVNVVTYGLKFTILMLSDQMKLRKLYVEPYETATLSLIKKTEC